MEEIKALSVSELAELKSITLLHKSLVAKAQEAQQVVALAEAYQQNYMFKLLTDRNLDPSVVYNISDKTGDITVVETPDAK